MADGEHQGAVVIELPDTEEAAERALRLATRAAVQLALDGGGPAMRDLAEALDGWRGRRAQSPQA